MKGYSNKHKLVQKGKSLGCREMEQEEGMRKGGGRSKVLYEIPRADVTQYHKQYSLKPQKHMVSQF